MNSHTQEDFRCDNSKKLTRNTITPQKIVTFLDKKVTHWL